MIAGQILKMVVLQLLLPELGSRCFRYTDCHTCITHKTSSHSQCHWCPLDGSCHAKWSSKNHCLGIKGLHHQLQCETVHQLSYDSDEAYKLLLFATAAYSDMPDKCLSALLPDTDYILKATIIKNCDDFLFEYDKQCLAFIAISHKNKEIIIAFRGTRGVKQLTDQVLSIIVTPSVDSPVGGKVQRYFNNVHDKLYKLIKQTLNELIHQYSNYSVKITGHSLGGAAASIASALLVQEGIVLSANISLYTFGMPRVGNKLYAYIHDRLVPNSWRVVRQGDLVTHLPACHLGSCSIFNGPFHHGKKVIYTEKYMRRDSHYIVCNGNEDSLSKCHQNRSTVFNAKMSAHKEYFGIPVGTYCLEHVLKTQ